MTKKIWDWTCYRKNARYLMPFSYILWMKSPILPPLFRFFRLIAPRWPNMVAGAVSVSLKNLTKLVLGQTWFGSRFGSVFWGSVGSRFGFWEHTWGSGGSRFGLKVRRTFLNLFHLKYCLILGSFLAEFSTNLLEENFYLKGGHSQQ